MPDTEQAKPDPTVNVKNIVKDAIDRIDDLREAEVKRVDEKFKDNDTKYQVQFNAAKEALGIALIAQEKAVAAALDASKEATGKSEISTDKQFGSLSEKIDGIAETINKNTGAQGIYVTHESLSNEMEKLRISFENMLRPVKTFMDNQQGRRGGLNAGWVYLIGGVSLIGMIISIFFAIAK